MSDQLWISAAMFVGAIILLAVVRGVRVAASTAAVLLVIGVGYVLLTRSFQDAGKWALAFLILMGGALAAFAKKRKR